MADHQKAPRDHFSLDEILAEARVLEEENHAHTENTAEAETGAPAKPAQSTQEPLPQKPVATPDDIAQQASRIPSTEPPKKKKTPSFFSRRRRKTEIPELEEDIYYGLQLKTLEDYEKIIQVDTKKDKRVQKDSMFSYLFSETDDNTVDNEISEQFDRMHQERIQRVEKIMRQAGVGKDDIFSVYNPQSAVLEPPKPEKAAPPKMAGPLLPEEAPVIEPGKPPVVTPPSPAPIPSPVPAPKPEIEPGPISSPEIREPVTEPVFQPAPEPLTAPMQPDFAPPIRYSVSDEPVKEPVPAPQVKEELPPAPPVREPQARPAPQSVKSAAQSYRAVPSAPVHLISLNDFENLLSAAAQDYPPPKPKQPPAPIPISRPGTGEPSAPGEPVEKAAGLIKNQTSVAEVKAPLSLEQTREFEAVRPAHPAAATQEIELISFPEPEPADLEEEDDEEVSPETENPCVQESAKKHFNLFGSEEEDNDTGDNLPGEAEELDDYSSPSDAPSISHELGSNIHELYLRLAVTGISMVLLSVFGFLGEQSARLPQVIQVGLNTQTYLILNLVFLLIATAFCGKTILNGIKSLFVFQANTDSAVAVADVAVLIQSVALMFSSQSVENETLHVYAPLVVIALFLNTAGKLSMVKRIEKNFRFVAAPDQKQAVQLFDDHNTALQMASGCVMDAPALAFQTKTNFLKNFLRLSYEPDPSDQSAQILSPIGFISSLILCIVTLVLSKDMFGAMTAFAAAACIFVPFANMLSVNLPVGRVSKIASRCGAMIVGYSAIDHFSSTNAVIVDAKELFPKGTVVLNALKTFGGQRIDDAIVDATALMCEVGGPLSDLFDQIIKSRRDMLPKIDHPVYEDDKGVTGWVSGRRILVGSRELMEAHQIEPPSRDYEDKYIHGGKKIVYLASGGDLVAMFVVSYSSDRRRAMELRRMEDNGISLIVRTCDPNITPRFLAECFGLDEHSVRVLPERLGSIYVDLTSAPQDRSPALMATKGRCTAMMRLLTACVRQRSNITIAIALQNVAVVLGFLLVAFLACYSGLQQLTTTALLIYELFWIAAILLVPRLRKP